MIGNDAFQETPIVEVCRGITKHHYLVTDVNDVARVVKEAFMIASTGRPGPVLIDIPKDIQQAKCVPNYEVATDLAGIQDREPEGEAGANSADCGGDQAGQAADDLCGRRNHQRRCERRTSDAGEEDGHPRDDDRDGARGISERERSIARYARACTARCMRITRWNRLIC